jgi:DNA-binding transcriptional LysR family regulator
MTLKQLEAFYLAATLGSFALAAQRVHVTQSSLSKRIAELEESVGAELFDRSSQRARLTEAGNRLMPMAAEMLELKERLKRELKTPTALTGTIRFGISELGALTWLPQFVSRVRAEHPKVGLQPHVDLGRRLEKQVARGELDFAIVAGPPEDPQIASHLVADVRFAWVAAPRRFRSRRVIDAAELSRHPVITMTEGSALTRAIEAWARNQGLQLERIVASNSLMAIVGLSIADIGISFLPEAFVRPWVKQGLLVSMRSDPPLPVLPYCFMHRRDDGRSLLQVLLRSVVEEADFTATVGLVAQSKND